MSVTATTIRMDSELKKQFDLMCDEFGMSTNTAFTIFAKAVVRSRSIPFKIEGDGAEKLAKDSFGESFFELRRQAASLPEMTLDEINNEIAAARAGR